MAAKELNITGQKFNKLTAITYVGNQNWEFKCDCGKIVVKKTIDVKRGKIKSCSRICTTGNPSKHPLYQTWDGIKKRCYQENATGYKNYGARGIKMCDRWKDSFWNFVEDMGEKPNCKCTIERLDNNSDYSKDNCIWSTPEIQANNKRNNIYISYKDEKYTLFNLCKKLNLKHSTVYWRIKNRAITAQEYFDKL